jgi:hypothetical protein
MTPAAGKKFDCTYLYLSFLKRKQALAYKKQTEAINKLG